LQNRYLSPSEKPSIAYLETIYGESMSAILPFILPTFTTLPEMSKIY